MSFTANEPFINDSTTGTKAGSSTYVSTDGGYLRLTTALNFDSGRFNYTGNLLQSIEMTCDFWAGGGSGADACWFFWGASADHTQEDSAVNSYSIALDEFSDQIQILFNGVTLTTASFANLDNSTWRQLYVSVTGQVIKIWMDSTLIIDFTDATVRTLGGSLFGWGGRCGGTNNEHRVRRILLSSPPYRQLGSKLRPAPFKPGIAR